MPFQGWGLRFGDGLHVDELAAIATFSEYNGTIDESVNSVVLTHSDIQTGMVYSATLTLDDVAGFGKLTTENLNTESFAFRLAAVLRTTNTFFMCHVSNDLWG